MVSCFSACLVTCGWMTDIVNFTLFGPGFFIYFYILELSWYNLRMTFSYLGKVNSFRSCFYDWLGGSGAQFSLSPTSLHTEARPSRSFYQRLVRSVLFQSAGGNGSWACTPASWMCFSPTSGHFLTCVGRSCCNTAPGSARRGSLPSRALPANFSRLSLPRRSAPGPQLSRGPSGSPSMSSTPETLSKPQVSWANPLARSPPISQGPMSFVAW